MGLDSEVEVCDFREREDMPLGGSVYRRSSNISDRLCFIHNALNSMLMTSFESCWVS